MEVPLSCRQRGEDSNQTTITNGPTASDDNSLSSSGAVYVFRSWEAECGNSILDQGEDCDDGNAIDDGDGCSETCVFNPVCGDGIVQPLFEACDDGFTDACGSCNADCFGAGSGSTCGDGEHCPETEFSCLELSRVLVWLPGWGGTRCETNTGEI